MLYFEATHSGSIPFHPMNQYHFTIIHFFFCISWFSEDTSATEALFSPADGSQMLKKRYMHIRSKTMTYISREISLSNDCVDHENDSFEL